MIVTLINNLLDNFSQNKIYSYLLSEVDFTLEEKKDNKKEKRNGSEIRNKITST